MLRHNTPARDPRATGRDASHRRRAAMSTRSRPLNPTDAAILDCLRAAQRPMSAYDVLDALRPMGINSPPTVYRALARLAGRGVIHRIESLRAFTVCQAPASPGRCIISICEGCGRVDELHDTEVSADLVQRFASKGFRVQDITMEVTGACPDCSR